MSVSFDTLFMSTPPWTWRYLFSFPLLLELFHGYTVNSTSEFMFPLRWESLMAEPVRPMSQSGVFLAQLCSKWDNRKRQGEAFNLCLPRHLTHSLSNETELKMKASDFIIHKTVDWCIISQKIEIFDEKPVLKHTERAVQELGFHHGGS